MADTTPSSSSTSTAEPITSPPHPTVIGPVQSTGNRWTDFQLAAKRISFMDDLRNIGEVPCARNSLLAGILSGTGMAFVRGWNAGAFVASNWAVGTFAVVSIGMWNVCRSSIQRERRELQIAIEGMAQRRAKFKPTPAVETQTEQETKAEKA